MIHTFTHILLITFGTVFLISGFCDFIKFIIQKTQKHQNHNETLLISPITNRDENVEFILRSTIGKVRWSLKNQPQKIIFLDCGIDENERKICEIICNDYEYAELWNKKELKEYIDKINESLISK